MTTTAPSRPGRLPAPLDQYRAALEEALQIPVFVEWPEGEAYCEAPQVWALFQVIRDALHDHLGNLRLAVCFREDLKSRDKQTLAKISKAGGKLAHFAEIDLVIEVNWTAWRTLSPTQKCALLDHQLCHAALDDESGKVVLLEHDIAEFTAIVHRWGAWKRDVRAFLHAAHQLDLFSVEAGTAAPEAWAEDAATQVVDHLAQNLEPLADQLAEGVGPDTTVTIEAGGRMASRRGRRKGRK